MNYQIEETPDNVGKKSKMLSHFLLVPNLSPGHMIPMVDMAHIIAERGALVTYITTPMNATRIKSTIDCVNQSGLPIRFVELPFSCKEAGVPEGCESFELVPSEYHAQFLNGMRVLQKPLETYLETMNSWRPTCIISDNFQHWTTNIAKKLNIPRLLFNGTSCFFNLCSHNIRRHKIYRDVRDEYQPVEVPDVPGKICVTSATSPDLSLIPRFKDWAEDVMKAEDAADGVVVNTFKGLELEFIEHFEKILGKRVWPIGPFCKKGLSNGASRGRKADIDETILVNWLDSKKSSSVILVAFGTQAESSSLQVIEIGCGLEASNVPFIWVLKECEMTPEVVNWMSNGFEERTRERGLVITGWAPQLLILSHPALGGMMTHCGWNSIMEAVCAGIPMITCPHLSDQFLNEMLVVDSLKIGISFGIKEPKYRIHKDKVRVGRDDVKKAVINLMKGEEGEAMRRRVQKYGVIARMAIEEGGSSFESLSSLIQFAAEPAKKSA